MTKSLAASKELMQTYLSELLTEDNVSDEQKNHSATTAQSTAVTTTKLKEKAVEELLESANVTKNTLEKKGSITSYKSSQKAFSPVESKTKPVEKTTIKTKHIETAKSKDIAIVKPKNVYQENSFQAMFFDVAGLIVAVPLVELGGIHNVDKTTALMGKPDWFTGVMIYRDEKINVVDTAQWVMPEKCDEELKSSINYQYVIMLSDSSWGLTAERLVDTVTLQPEDVKWLDNSTKRPWLAGLVKDRMCALLNVESLITLLEQGANIS